MFCDYDESGTISIWVAVLCAICMMVSIALGNVGYATTGVAQAQNAADSAALSAAFEIAHSNNDFACSSARMAAQRNDAQVVSCRYTNENVEIVVALKTNREIQAQARAEVK